MDSDQNLYKNVLIISFVYREVINQTLFQVCLKLGEKKQEYVNIAKKYTTKIISKAFCFVSFC